MKTKDLVEQKGQHGIGKLHSSTTEEELADYLEEKGISGNKTVEDKQSKGPNKEFRLAVPLDFLEQRTEVLAKGSNRKALAREFAGD